MTSRFRSISRQQERARTRHQTHSNGSHSRLHLQQEVGTNEGMFSTNGGGRCERHLLAGSSSTDGSEVTRVHLGSRLIRVNLWGHLVGPGRGRVLVLLLDLVLDLVLVLVLVQM